MNWGIKMSTLAHSLALSLALCATAPGAAHALPINFLDSNPGTVNPSPAPGAGGCAAVGTKSENDANVADFTQGIGNWKWGLNFTSEAGFSSDCNISKVSASAGFDVKLLGLTVPALDFELWAGTDASNHNSVAFSIYAMNKEIRTLPIVESEGLLVDWLPIDVTLPGTEGLNGSWTGNYEIAGQNVRTNVRWTFADTLQGQFLYVVNRKRVLVYLQGEANLSANVTGSGAVTIGGSEYGSATVSGNAIGLIATGELKAEANAIYHMVLAPPNAKAKARAFKKQPMLDMDNAWKVDLRAWRNIHEALKGKVTVSASAKVPNILTSDPNDTVPWDASFDVYDVGGIPESLKGSKLYEKHKIYYFTF